MTEGALIDGAEHIARRGDHLLLCCALLRYYYSYYITCCSGNITDYQST
jgi:hypothetical protein